MIVFLKCVAKAIVEHGLHELAKMVPGGEFAYAVAKGALDRYRKEQNAAGGRAEMLETAQANYLRAHEAAQQVVREIAPKEADERDLITLEIYLSQIPGSVRHSLKRPEDPTGTTVPASFALNTPQDVLKLLPPMPVQFRPGEPLPERPGWKLIQLLGAGGFGEVWLVENEQLSSLRRAVKFCRGRQADLLDQGKVIARVMKEGDVPGIAPLLDMHLQGDTPWLMFEYVSGGDLSDVIFEWQKLPPSERLERAKATLHELADTVGHFHRLNPAIVHQDLKPANILREKSGKLRITDFGIGGVYTPLYASPQQRDGAAPDPRDDVHALGVIGYQMCTGKLNQGPGPGFAKVLRGAGASEDFIEILGRCCDENVEPRWKNAWELAQQLSIVQPLPPKILIQKMTGQEYYERIKAEKDPQDGSGILSKRLQVIRAIRQLFANHQHFEDIDELGRKQIAGLYKDDNINFLWFGSMKGAGRFKQAISNNNSNLSQALDCIIAKGTISSDDYWAYIDQFKKALPRGGGIATATRLLAMKRPDTFVCVNGGNKESLCQLFNINPNIGYESYWDGIIEQVKAASWWKVSPPSDPTEREIWEARAALLDSLCYDYS